MSENKLGLLRVEDTVLLAVDLQERLMPVIAGAESVVRNTNRLLAGAEILGMKSLISEQYPKGLGNTVDQIEKGSCEVFEKNCFSCMLHDQLGEILYRYKSAVICGVETHICVLKTALDMLSKGMQVHVVADAVGSRTEANKQIGLDRLRQSGAFITSTEMVLFQCLDFAGTDQFKQISKLIK